MNQTTLTYFFWKKAKYSYINKTKKQGKNLKSDKQMKDKFLEIQNFLQASKDNIQLGA